MNTSSLLTLLHALIIVIVSVRVVMRRPARGVALAWLFIVAALPFLGGIAYFLIGERRIRRSRRAGLTGLRGDLTKLAHEEGGTSLVRTNAFTTGLSHQGLTYFGMPASAGNEVALLSGAKPIMAWLVADIDAALTSILIEFYIWADGGDVEMVADALERAAKRGVDCRVLVDALGAEGWWRGQGPRRLEEAGVQVRKALPMGALDALIGRTDLRLHRKIVVIDGLVGWTGSMNMVDPRFFKQNEGVGQWIDAMVRVEGPAVAMLAAVVADDWSLETGEAAGEVVVSMQHAPGKPMGKLTTQVLPSGPGQSQDGLLQVLLTLINGAAREIVLTTPYLVPDDALVTALRGACSRGVRLTVVVPERVDSLMVRLASRSYYDEIMEFGGQILLYRGGLLHTKSLVADETVSLFGTVNLDMRSLWLNYEVAMLIYDARFARQLRQLQQSYVADSVAVDPAVWAKRRASRKFFESCLRLMSPLL
jgi:cardiolipin synthase